MQRKHVFSSLRDFLVTLANRGISYLGGKTDFTSACACAVHEFYHPNTVKIPTPNITRFAHVIPNTPGKTRKTFFPCIKYRMQLRAKRVLGLR